jgi:hypothetical protein
MIAPVNSRFEQHIGTIMQAAVIGLLAWSLKTSVDLNQQVGILQVQVSSLQNTVTQGANDRYRGTDAARDFSAVWSEFNRQSQRIDKLESRR